MKSNNKVPYGKQSINQDDIDQVIKVLSSEFLTQGPIIKKFEKALAKKVGAKYCVVVNSGTAALHAAYFACGLDKNSQLITSPMTFAATANAALYLGAEVKFVDISLETGNLDYKKITSKLSSKTKVVALIHYAGLPADMQQIYKVVKDYNPKIKIVEDACHALGAKYQDKVIGSCQYSDATVFSFHPVKNITTGEGGAVTTNDEEIYQKLLLFRSHGISKNSQFFQNKSDGAWYHEMQLLGYNYRLPDILAALGLSQLSRLNNFIKSRQLAVEKYQKLFSDQQFFEIPKINFSDRTHALHLYSIRLRAPKLKQKLVKFLQTKNIFTQVHYIPVYKHPFYQQNGYENVNCPQAEKFYQQELSLPIFANISLDQIKYVGDQVLTFFKNNE